DDHLGGAVELRPCLRPEVTDIISGLRDRGVKHLSSVSAEGTAGVSADLAQYPFHVISREGFPFREAEADVFREAERLSISIVRKDAFLFNNVER
ncbi:MAG: hypothetical protein B6245_21245, partial [Desulfobacteraceae bacterium 4572_88]